MKCNLDTTELQELYLIFFNINQAEQDIAIAEKAMNEYLELINKINCLDHSRAEEGMVLCEEAIKKVALIRTGEEAKIELKKFSLELNKKLI